MSIQEFVKPELLVLVPVLYLIGAAIKKSGIKDKWIPLLLGGAAVVLAATYVFATSAVTTGRDIATAAFTAITQGILCAGASVYANQIYAQSKKEE